MKAKTWAKILVGILIAICARSASRNAPDSSDLFLQQARLEYRSGRLKTAETRYSAALKAIGRNNDNARAAALAELGDVYVNLDELSKAERSYLDSLAIYKRLHEKDSTILILRNLGATYSLERRNEDALRVLGEALASATADTRSNRLVVAEVLNCLGIVYYRMGDTNQAEAILNQALQSFSNSGVPFDRAGILNNLGAVYQAQHKFDRAENLFKEALRITESKKGALHPDLTVSLNLLGLLYTAAGRYSEAEEQFQQALKILQPDKSSFDSRVTRILQDLSVTYRKAGRNAEADDTLARAKGIARRNVSNEAKDLRVEAKRDRFAAGFGIDGRTPF